MAPTVGLTLRHHSGTENIAVGLRFFGKFVHPSYGTFRVSYLFLNKSCINPNPRQLRKERYFFHFLSGIENNLSYQTL